MKVQHSGKHNVHIFHAFMHCLIKPIENISLVSLGDNISNRPYDYSVNLSDTDSSYTSDIDISSNTF